MPADVYDFTYNITMDLAATDHNGLLRRSSKQNGRTAAILSCLLANSYMNHERAGANPLTLFHGEGAERQVLRKNERAKAWAAANREKARASNRQSYEKRRRDRLEYMRRWRKANKEKINEYQREYRQRGR